MPGLAGADPQSPTLDGGLAPLIAHMQALQAGLDAANAEIAKLKTEVRNLQGEATAEDPRSESA